MNTFKDQITIYLQLIQVEAEDVQMLLSIQQILCLKKKFFEQSFEYDKKNKSNEKHEQNISHANANCNSNQKWNNYK